MPVPKFVALKTSIMGLESSKKEDAALRKSRTQNSGMFESDVKALEVKKVESSSTKSNEGPSKDGIQKNEELIDGRDLM